MPLCVSDAPANRAVRLIPLPRRAQFKLDNLPFNIQEYSDVRGPNAHNRESIGRIGINIKY